jgi:hypothetical protein
MFPFSVRIILYVVIKKQGDKMFSLIPLASPKIDKNTAYFDEKDEISNRNEDESL